MALAALRVSERSKKRHFGAFYASSGAEMSLNAAGTQMCVRADSLEITDRAAPSGSCAVLCRG